MNLKLLFLCVFLAVLIIPAEVRKHKHDRHRHRHHPHHPHHHHHHHHDHRHDHHSRPDRRRGRFEEILNDIFFQIVDGSDDEEDEDDHTEWLYDLQEPEGRCNPNPCLHNGVCEEKGNNNFKCDCPEPFKGKKCQRGPKVCWRGRCGRGECVLTSVPPYYECKCKEPFQPPNCRTVSLCDPNPCKNGGTCIQEGRDFDCQCPVGFSGQFCHVGPDDCFEDDGESYRGNVSETQRGHECLYWNSHFILDRGTDPFQSFEDPEGLGPHNYCRNPDGDSEPWCFYRKGHKLLWDYCDVMECYEPTDAPTTEDTLTVRPSTAPEVPDVPIIHPPAPDVTAAPTRAPVVTTALGPAPDVVKPPTAAPPAPSVTPSVAEPEQFSTCGNPQPKKVYFRIYGGLKVTPGSIPWQVSLQVRKKGFSGPYKHICGGVLIQSCWVLTAAHCIDPLNDMRVVAGGLSLDEDEATEQTLPVSQAIVHQQYRETSSSVSNDIALLKLEGSNGVCANETQFVKTACLPSTSLPDGTECTISGWGATEQSYGSNHLLDAQVLLINQEKCSESHVYGKVLDQSMFCAGYLQGGVDSCQGDSGGPLTCKQNNTHAIYGLVSWGDKCGRENKPGVYTRISHFVDWVKSNIAANS